MILPLFWMNNIYYWDDKLGFEFFFCSTVVVFDEELLLTCVYLAMIYGFLNWDFLKIGILWVFPSSSSSSFTPFPLSFSGARILVWWAGVKYVAHIPTFKFPGFHSSFSSACDFHLSQLWRHSILWIDWLGCSELDQVFMWTKWEDHSMVFTATPNSIILKLLCPHPQPPHEWRHYLKLHCVR